MKSTRVLTLLAAVTVVAGCTADVADRRTESIPSGDSITLPSAAGPIDGELAASGARLFRSKGCVACHTVGEGNRIGPDLEGITDRREPGWIAAMIMHPDSMIAVDPVAKRLLADYMTPMPSLEVAADEARSIYEYLRQEQ